MSSPVNGAGAGAGADAAAGLAEPLLANITGFTVAPYSLGGDDPDSKEKKGGVAARKKEWCWEDVPQPEPSDDLESGGDGRRLFRTMKVKNILLYPYWALILIRVIAVTLFISWRIKNNNSDVMWFWALSIAGDVWFAVTWLAYQLPKHNPVKTVPDLAALRRHYDLPDGGSRLPGIDVFVTTADPTDEPILYTMNCVLSVLAADYPVDRYTCYLSDDSGELILYEALADAASFAALWVPFCRKHRITAARAPERFFETEGLAHTAARSVEDHYVGDYSRVRAEYEEFKLRLEKLPETIRRRSDAYNSKEKREGDDAKATWMADGTQWPGTWIDPNENHSKANHAGVVQIVQEHPSCNSRIDRQMNSINNPLYFDGIDERLPMLIYVAREKSTHYEHNKKAGALNTQLRISALLSNAPFIINFDCDHYINNCLALRAAMCFMLDPQEGDDIAFVQFPQRFDNVDPTDRYGNHNRVFFDGMMLGLNGLQGPTYLGTGCMFRRVALYGIDPPRRRAHDFAACSDKFGGSVSFLRSVLAAVKQERCVVPPTIDEAFRAEMVIALLASYDVETDWGKGVGYIYRIATEDIVTGFRMHGQGWRSIYCTIEPEAFRGTAPISLVERLHQIVRWSGGSLEMFFSHNNPVIGGRLVHLLQRVSYLNTTVYPITSLFILMYSLCPIMWLLPDEILLQRPFTRYVMYLIIILLLIHAIGVFEVEWSGITWMDWWRNEQFFMVGSMSAYPTAVLHMTAKLLTNRGSRFRVTSKQPAAADDTNDKFADLYVMQWVPMLIPATVVLFSNIMAIGVALGKAVLYMGTWSPVRRRHSALGLLFNFWIMVLLYPFALAVIGRWAKRPGVLFILLPIAFVAIALLYIIVHFFLLYFLPFMVI